jgi:hypothetical protein
MFCLPASASQPGKDFIYLILSLTPKQATGNALTISVQNNKGRKLLALSVFQLAHLVKCSISVNAWLGIIESPGEVRSRSIVPDEVKKIKTEKVGMECGWEMGVTGI